MKRLITVLTFLPLAVLLNACITTVDLPLYSQHIMRPRADTDSRIHAQIGFVKGPDMTNTLPAIHNQKGEVLNNNDSGKLFGEEDEEEPTVDLGYESDSKWALGVSNYRGVYALYDFYDNYGLTYSLTGSYSKRGDVEGKLEANEYYYRGWQDTSTLAAMASYRYGPSSWLQMYPYAALGLVHTRNSLKTPYEKVRRTDNLPSVVFGYHLELKFFQVVIEKAFLPTFKGRGQEQRVEDSTALSAGFNIDF